MVTGDYVHVNCKKEYIHIWYIAKVAKKKDQSDVDRRKTRSSQPSFNFKTKCFFLWKRGQHTGKVNKGIIGSPIKIKRDQQKCC